MVKLISPAPGGRRGLAFGDTRTPPYTSARPHRGDDWEREWADLSKPRPVVASAGGRVTSVYSGSGRNQGWGRRVEITVPSSSDHIVVALNHLDTVSARLGADIPAGGYVGEMGNSGEAFGVHLHEELWINGVRVNPNTYRTRDLPGTAGTPAGGGSRPFDPEEIESMSKSTIIVRMNPAGHIFTMGPEFLKHETDSKRAEFIASVLMPDAKYLEVSQERFDALCESFAVPSTVAETLLRGRGYNLEGKVGNGRVWSRSYDIGQTMSRIETQLGQVAERVEAAVQPGAEITSS